MSENIKDRIGRGMSPESFMEQMEKNRDLFLSNYNGFTIPEDTKNFFEEQGKKDIRCVIITADWCGDAARSVPVVFQLMQIADIPTEVFLVDDNPDFIDQFRVLGGRSVPVILFVNDEGDVLSQWGPRPAYIQEPMAEFKALGLAPDSDEYKEKVRGVYQEIMARYGEGTEYQPLVINEIREHLRTVPQ